MIAKGSHKGQSAKDALVESVSQLKKKNKKKKLKVFCCLRRGGKCHPLVSLLGKSILSPGKGEREKRRGESI